jgi:hypothetical protein
MTPYDIRMRLNDVQFEELERLLAEVTNDTALDPAVRVAAIDCITAEIDRLDVELSKLGTSDDGKVDDGESWGNMLDGPPAEG